MTKRLQQDSGEERVTAKSKPMMNLSARMPSVVSSSTSLSPVKRCYGKQDPWRSVVADDRSGQPDKLSSTDYSKSDYDCAWSSQEWKAEATMHDRSGQPDKTSWRMVQQVRPHHGETLLDGDAQSVRYGGILRDRSGQPDDINFQEVADSANFVMGSDAAEFVNKVNNQVRKKQKIMSNVAGSGEEHSIIWGMFMAATMNFQDNQNSIMNTTDLTLKKMFDISAKLVGEQDEIFNVDKIHWEKHSWKHLSLIGDETVINLQRAKVYVFSDSVLCLGRVHQHRMSNEAWKERIGWIITDQSYRDYDGISRVPTEFEWNKWYSLEENSPQGIWDHIAEKMLLEFAESGCPIFRATTPLSRCNLKSKGHGKLSIHFAADHQTIETVFRIIVFANQLSLYGAVAEHV